MLFKNSFFRVLSCSTDFDKTNQSRPYRTVSTRSRNNVEQNRRPGQPPGTRSTHRVLVLPTVRGTTTVSCHVRKLSAHSTPRSALYSTGDSVPVQAPAITRSTGKTGGFMTRRRTSYCRRAGLLNCVTSGREKCGKCDAVVTGR